MPQDAARKKNPEPLTQIISTYHRPLRTLIRDPGIERLRREKVLLKFSCEAFIKKVVGCM
jgi:hypothetical protein